jgi:ABC-type multidrug transport system ATPase subunit
MIELDFFTRAGPCEVEVSTTTEHSVVLIQGQSGAGKTTALRAICGLVPAEGRVALGDQVWLKKRRFLRPEVSIGYVPQAGGAFLGQSVRRNVELVAAAPRAADDWLEACGLGDVADRRVGDLSGGQLRRMAVARALATEAGLLVFDEPFAGLDAKAMQQLLSVIVGSVGPRRPLFISSHTGETELFAAFSGAVCVASVLSGATS